MRIAFATEQKFNLGFFALDITHRTRDSKSFYKDYGYTTPDLTKVDALSFSPRFRFPFETGTVHHSFVIGGDWDRWNWNYFSSDVDVVPSSTAQQVNTSLYLRHTSNFNSGTSIALGIREQRTVNDVNFSNAIAQQNRTTPAYEIALRQDLQGGWSLHAKSGKSFRLQTVDELRPPWGSIVPTVLEPQTSQDLDIGARYADSALTVGLSLFRMKL